MIKNGKYCTFKNLEYELTMDMDGNLLIISKDPLLLKEGFIDVYESGVYSKVVKSSELSNCHRVSIKGKIKGEIVNVYREDKYNYYVGTSDAEVARKLGLERTDKYYYEKWVPKNEVGIFEERKEIKL